jgi:hypothetical protein
MNYLTNYYKNLSEQLQEKVNHLQKLLEKRETEEVLVTGYKVTGQGPTTPSKMKILGRFTKGKGSKRGREVEVDAGDVYAGHKLLGKTSPIEALLAGTSAFPDDKIGTSETPTITVPKKDLSPDHYDGRDADLRADSREVFRGKTEEQMRALLPTVAQAEERRRMMQLYYGD